MRAGAQARRGKRWDEVGGCLVCCVRRHFMWDPDAQTLISEGWLRLPT
jgi:hypothetical protein